MKAPASGTGCEFVAIAATVNATTVSQTAMHSQEMDENRNRSNSPNSFVFTISPYFFH